MKRLGSHWTDFHETWFFLNTFRKSLEALQVSLKSDKNSPGTLHEDQCTFFIISRSRLLRMGNVSGKKIVDKIKTQIIFSNAFLKIVQFMR